MKIGTRELIGLIIERRSPPVAKNSEAYTGCHIPVLGGKACGAPADGVDGKCLYHSHDDLEVMRG